MSPILIAIIWTIVSLAMILTAAELFTNAIEWLGRKLKLSEGAVGSVLAAVGTALPETIIPIVAIFQDITHGRLRTPESTAQDVGLGAIIGAPFMLGTLAFCLVGTTYFIAKARRKRTRMFDVKAEIIESDVIFFLIAFSIGCGAGLLKHYWTTMPLVLDWVLAGGMMVVYFVYLARTLKAGASHGHSDAEELHPLHVGHVLKESHDPRKRVIAIQVLGALGLMFYGAHQFVHYFSTLAEAMNVNPLVLALLIVPVATELPEKFNSAIWVSRGKDTLAMGNISGAMVFQSTFPISLGLIFLDWSFSPTHPAFVGGMLGVLGALAVLINLRITREVSPVVLLCAGGLYLTYIILVILQLNGVHIFDLSAGLGHGQ
ncbi:sodium:calcium antiporter [bacterium]|nr:sodium:calcium antiporter [bacterium]